MSRLRIVGHWTVLTCCLEIHILYRVHFFHSLWRIPLQFTCPASKNSNEGYYKPTTLFRERLNFRLKTKNKTKVVLINTATETCSLRVVNAESIAVSAQSMHTPLHSSCWHHSGHAHGVGEMNTHKRPENVSRSNCQAGRALRRADQAVRSEQEKEKAG